MPIINEIISLPIAKVFVMTDASNHPFVLSFHFHNRDLCFSITPNRANPITKVPVYEGTCYSINSFMDMLTAYGCKYIKRLPIERGEVLSRDYLDGLADGIIIATPKTVNCCPCCDNCCECDDDTLYEYIGDMLFDPAD